MATRRPPIHDYPHNLIPDDEGGGDAWPDPHPPGDNRPPKPGDDEIPPHQSDWQFTDPGFQSWYEAGGPSNRLSGDASWWEGGRRGGGGEHWWADPADWQEHFTPEYQADTYKKWGHSPDQESVWQPNFQWEIEQELPGLKDRAGMEGAKARYADQFGSGGWDSRHTERARNIGDFKGEYDAMVDAYNTQAAAGHLDWRYAENERKNKAAAAEAARIAALKEQERLRLLEEERLRKLEEERLRQLREDQARADQAERDRLARLERQRKIDQRKWEDDQRRSGLIEGGVEGTPYEDQSTAGTGLGESYDIPQGGDDVEVGTDELSESITAAIFKLLEGDTSAMSKAARTRIMEMLSGEYQWPDIVPAGSQIEDDIEAELRHIIDTKGGDLYGDPNKLAMQLEQARTPIDMLRDAQTRQSRAGLAARGMAGPTASGQESQAMQGIEGRLAPQYAQAGQGIALQAMQQREGRLANALTKLQELGSTQAQRQVGYDTLNSAARQAMDQTALSAATGMSQLEASNLLSAIGLGTQRQQVLSDIALRSLDQNITWNQFLAEYGMNRDTVLEQLRKGRIDQLQPIMELFISFLDKARSGVVIEGAGGGSGV